MRHVKSNFKIIISVILILFFIPEWVVSQENEFKINWQNHLFFGISGGLAQTNIKNNGISTISELSIVKKKSFSGSIDIGYFFSKYFGLSTGVGISSYETHLFLDVYVNSFDTIDSEQEAYQRRISGNDIKEIQKISFLNIPLLVNLQLPISEYIGLYVQSGINFSIPVSKTYSSTGIFSYSGYYPAYNIQIDDVPYEGFKSNVNNDVDGELKIKKFIPELTSSAGFNFYLQKKFQVSFGLLELLHLSGQ